MLLKKRVYMKFRLAQPQFIHEIGKRNNQEDTLFPSAGQATADDRLFIVCDGMGGHEHGEVASRIVSDTFSSYVHEHVGPDTVFTDDMFNEALQLAYAELDKADPGTSHKKMGTTLTFLLFHKGGCFMAHIGDSRIYHVRPDESRFLYMSRDHSLVFELFRSGEISYDEMKTHPKKNVITRAMMPGEDNRVAAETVNTTDIQPGDYFYLCSDGMLEQSEESDIMGILSSENTDEAKQQRLISATLDNKDNHTAYILRVESVEAEPGDSDQRNDESTSRSNVVNYLPELNKVVVTKVATGDFVSDGPVEEKVKKKFPWVKIMLLLIAVSAFTLFYYIPKQREEAVLNWEKNQEKSTIKDTLTHYNNPDERSYAQEKRDSIEASQKKAAEAKKSGSGSSVRSTDRGSQKQNRPKQNTEQRREKKRDSKPRDPQPVERKESSGGGGASQPSAAPAPAPTPAPQTAAPATPPVQQGAIDESFQ